MSPREPESHLASPFAEFEGCKHSRGHSPHVKSSPPPHAGKPNQGNLRAAMAP